MNSAAVSFDYAVTDREPEPGAHYSFCRKERLEDVIAHLAGHSDSAIGHARSHKSAFCPGGDFQPPTLRHRVERVENEVDEDFAQLRAGPSHRLRDDWRYRSLCMRAWAASLSSAITHPAAPGESLGTPTWVMTIFVRPPTVLEFDPDLGRRGMPLGHAHLRR